MQGRFYGEPIKLHWLGWETDTQRLQRFGWNISAHQDVAYRQMGLAIKHRELPIEGMAGVDAWEYQYLHQHPHAHQREIHAQVFKMNLAHHLTIRHVGELPLHHPVDAELSYTSERITSLQEMAHFKTIGGAQDIYLKEASMDEILEFALKKQEPRQAEIRKRMMREKEMSAMQSNELKASLRLV